MRPSPAARPDRSRVRLAPATRRALLVLGLAAPAARGLRAQAAPATEAAAPAPSDTRPRLNVDLLTATHYVWRGVTYTNRPVLDPTVTLDMPTRHGTITLGAWGNLEPRAYTGQRDINTYDGARGPLLTMSQLWLEAKRTFRSPLGEGMLTVGATEYLYPDIGDLADVYQTGELYAMVNGGGALSPTVAVWVDPRRVRGTYVESSVGYRTALPSRLPTWLGASRPLQLQLAAGASAGMTEHGDDAAYFTRDGLTHLELTITSEVSLGALTLLPTTHLIMGRDPVARVVAPDASRAVKAWVGGTLRWSGPVGRRRAAVDASAAANGNGAGAK